MSHPIRIIAILAFLGFCVGIFSGGDLKNLNIQKIGNAISSFDLGPLNWVKEDISSAYVFARDNAIKLVQDKLQH